MSSFDTTIRDCVAQAASRSDLWIHFIHAMQVRRMAEVGVFRGEFAAAMLAGCDALDRYYMIDPWRHLDAWNKPANEDDRTFEGFLADATARTDFAAARRTILRGKTTEVVDRIPDGELDLAYVDGDHTLRGVAIDLIALYPKIRVGGFLAGDDFGKSVWQHRTSFEPTLVFPFAVYFAEAIGARMYGLPRSQFIMEKSATRAFEFIDLTGRRYGDTSLQSQFRLGKILKLKIAEMMPFGPKFQKKIRKMLHV
jgi:hypothetical protein